MITSTTTMVYVADDGTIGIDGNFLLEMESSHFDWVPSDIHAFHWYGDEYGGEIEYKQPNPFADKPPNERISELGIWENLEVVFREELARREEALRLEQEAFEASRDYWQELRGIRDSKLYECDWTQLPDNHLTEEQRNSWTTYRQELRDLPSNIADPKPLVNDPNHESWPVPPS